MATGTGLDAQLGVKVETTHGTAVTVDRFYPFVSESVAETPEQVVSQGIIAGRLTRDTEQHKVGTKAVAGSVETDLFQENAALLWQFALGSVSSTSTAGSAPYTHTVTLADTLPSYTLQKGVSNTSNGGGVTAYTYAGVKTMSFTFSGSVGEPAKFKWDVTGGAIETTGTALAAASFASNAAVPFIFTEGSATIAGSAHPAASFEFNGNNHLTDSRIYAGDEVTREQLRAARFEGSGKVSVEFVDPLTTTFQAGTDIDIVLVFSDGTNSVTLTVHTILTGSTAATSGTGITMVDLAFADLYGDGTDNDAITAVVVNSGSLTP